MTVPRPLVAALALISWLGIASAFADDTTSMAQMLKALQDAAAAKVPSDGAGSDPRDMAQIMKALQNGRGGNPPAKKGPPLPAFKPVDASTSAAVIPQVVGLTVVAARSEAEGDFEWIPVCASSAAKG